MSNALSNTLSNSLANTGPRGRHNRLPNFQRLCAQQTQLGIRELDIQFALFLVEQEQALGNRDNLSSALEREIKREIKREVESEVESEALDALAVVACCLSFELSKGHVCIDSVTRDTAPSTHYQTLLTNSIPKMMDCQVVHCVDASQVTAQGMAHEAIVQETMAQEAQETLVQETNAQKNLARKPIIIDGGRVYLHRYWFYEFSLYQNIQARLTPVPWRMDPAQTSAALRQLFNLNHKDAATSVSEYSGDTNVEPDWQAVAAYVASQFKFGVISGGPGTGKTTTVIRLLALLVEAFLATQKRAPIMLLAAPTGKAAMRLSESIKGAKQALDVDEKIKQHLPEEASTLHRLLKQDRQGTFRHNASDPLHVDVLIVDEASMVDLPLMAKLMDALPQDAQIILLGDKDQLASVEAGSVLGDICGAAVADHVLYSAELLENIQSVLGFALFDENTNENENENENESESESEVNRAELAYQPTQPAQCNIADHLCQLRKSYRFHQHSGIGHLARAANAGDLNAWQQVANNALGADGEQTDANYNDIAIWSGALDQHAAAFEALVVQGYGPYLSLPRLDSAAGDSAVLSSSVSDSPELDALALKAHEAFSAFQILCALRSGESGVSGVNQLVERILQARQLIAAPSLHHQTFGHNTDGAEHEPRRDWYHGRPVIIMENDYALNLFNGDIGIAMQVPAVESTEREASDNGSTTTSIKVSFVTADGKVRWVKPSRLPKHETVYAMTIHKSQGSEFEHCVMVLPPVMASVLNKELIYTGITRAKQQLTLIGDPMVIRRSLSRRVQRASGLGERLWAGRLSAAGAKLDSKSDSAALSKTELSKTELSKSGLSKTESEQKATAPTQTSAKPSGNKNTDGGEQIDLFE